MFKDLVPLLQDGDVTVHLHLEADGRIRVTTVPKPADKATAGAAFMPLGLVGTPDELDDGFAEAIKGYTAERRPILEQVKEQQAKMKQAAEAAKLAAKSKAKTTTAKAGAKADAKADAKSLPGKAATDAAGAEADARQAASTETVAPAKATPSAKEESAPKEQAASEPGTAADAPSTDTAALTPLTEPTFFEKFNDQDLVKIYADLVDGRARKTTKPDRSKLAKKLAESFDSIIKGKTPATSRTTAMINWGKREVRS